MPEEKRSKDHAPPGTGEWGTKREGPGRQKDASPKKPGDGPNDNSPPDFGQSVESA